MWLGGPPCCPLTTSPDFQSPCVTRPPDSPPPSVSCVPSPCLSPALPISLLPISLLPTSRFPTSLLPISLLPTSRLPSPYLPSSCLAVSHSPCLPVPLLSPLTFVFISLFWKEPPHLYLHYLIPGSASLCTRYRDPDRWRIDGNILVLKQKFSNCNFLYLAKIWYYRLCIGIFHPSGFVFRSDLSIWQWRGKATADR